MKILSIAITLGLSLSVFGGHAVGLNSIEKDSLPPIKVVERTLVCYDFKNYYPIGKR
jgi:hypothetical protein